MNDLAFKTGGKAYYNTNDIMRSVREAVQDAKVSYTLGYYPSDLKLDGSFRRIKVRIQGEGLKVRHRLGYYDVDQPSSKDLTADHFRNVLWSPIDSTGVTLDAGARRAANKTRTM